MAGKAKTKPSNGRARPARSRGIGFPSLRLLPVTILVVSLTLFVRISDIWKGIDVTALSVNQSEAQQPPPPGGRKRGQRSPEQPPASAAAPAAAASSAAAPSSQAPSTLASPPAPPPAVGTSGGAEGEPPTFSQNEIDVLQKLLERREALDARQHDLDMRDNMVKAAESRIDKKIAEMKALQASVQSMLKQVDDQDDGKMNRLVKIYENMKPKDAAKIFEQLDLPVLLGVMAHMKEQKVAPIMEAMDPMKAKTITDSMAMRRGAKSEGQGGG